GVVDDQCQHEIFKPAAIDKQSDGIRGDDQQLDKKGQDGTENIAHIFAGQVGETVDLVLKIGLLCIHGELEVFGDETVGRIEHVIQFLSDKGHILSQGDKLVDQ